MNESTMLTLAAFAMASSFVGLIFILVGRRRNPLDSKPGGPPGPGGSAAVPEVQGIFSKKNLSPAKSMFMPTNEEGRKKLGERLIQAGLYKNNSVLFYVSTKSFLIIIPIAMGIIVSTLGMLTMSQGVLFGLIAGGIGTIAPSFWLDMQKKKRETAMKRALPDALDVIIVCLEGGLSLPGAFAKVSTELRSAHPMLAAEMSIVQREIQLGRSTGQALQRLAERFDVEEIRSMASVIVQAERFGASVVKALRVHADSLRLKRRQQAEEKAQKASVKLIFPTVLCIFPALFVVLMGPAAYDIAKMFAVMREATGS